MPCFSLLSGLPGPYPPLRHSALKYRAATHLQFSPSPNIPIAHWQLTDIFIMKYLKLNSSTAVPKESLSSDYLVHPVPHDYGGELCFCMNYLRCLLTMKASIAHQRQPPAHVSSTRVFTDFEQLQEGEAVLMAFKVLFLVVHRPESRLKDKP